VLFPSGVGVKCAKRTLGCIAFCLGELCRLISPCCLAFFLVDFVGPSSSSYLIFRGELSSNQSRAYKPTVPVTVDAW
jgi:hypothetical protein